MFNSYAPNLTQVAACLIELFIGNKQAAPYQKVAAGNHSYSRIALKSFNRH